MTVTSSPRGSLADPLRFTVTDVTGFRRLDFESVDGHRTAADVALSVAEAMDLPTDVPWSFRDESRAKIRDIGRPLQSQIEVGAELVVVPRSHLG